MVGLYGFLQIILESLPISSSGHLVLLGLQASTLIERFVHGPTILVLLLYFGKELWKLVCEWRKKWRQLICWGILIVFANSWTVLVYALLEKFDITHVPLWLGFFVTGCALISLRFVPEKNRIKERDLFTWGVIGFLQGLARLSGISRLATTYVAASWLGFNPKQAFRVSCALQVPLFAVGFLEGVWGLVKIGDLASMFSLERMVCGFCAMVIAYFLLAWVEHLMVTKKLWYVGLYMMSVTFFVLFANTFLVGM